MKLYDYAEAAKELRVEESWLRKNTRKFPKRKAGRKVHFTDDHLDQINKLLEVQPEFGPLARPAPVPQSPGGHPLAALKPLPARNRA